MTIQERITAIYSSDPGRIFCHFYQEGKVAQISYEKLLTQSTLYAQHYRSAGLKKGDTIVIILKHCPDLYSAFAGALLLGCIPSFFAFPTPKQDLTLYWKEHEELFERLNIGLLVTYEENIEEITHHTKLSSRQILNTTHLSNKTLTRELPDALRELTCDQEISKDDIAFLQHSSGTTGLKKGVALTHNAVLKQIDSYAEALALNKTDCIASWLPLYHDMGLIACFLLPVIKGIPVVSLDAFEWVMNPAILFEGIEKHRCTLSWLPNFAFHHLCRAKVSKHSYNLHSMRAFINCSEPCKSETFELFLKEFASSGLRRENLQVCYAMAEAVFAVSQTTINTHFKKISASRQTFLAESIIVPPQKNEEIQNFLSAGRPVEGVTIKIVDPNNDPLPENHVGEITVSSPFLFSGYYGNPEETRARLSEGWYHTKDLGFFHENELYVIGRMDDVIITHGKNFYAHDIEAKLNQIEGVKAGRTVAFGVYIPETGTKEVVCVVELEHYSEETAKQFQPLIRRKIAASYDIHLYDVECVPLGSIVKTTSGKISREGNCKKYLACTTWARV